jgi:hypothetical protein
MDSGAVIKVGADIYLLDTDIRPPIAQAAGHLSIESPGSRLGVASPEQEKPGIFSDISHYIGIRHHLADRFHTPDMLRSPIPAFPTVRIPGL